MIPLSHSSRRQPARAALTVRELIAYGARRLVRARVHFGHGTDNAWDESAALVLHALDLPIDLPPRGYLRRVDRAGAERARGLIERRISRRIPAVYLTGRSWFAGLQLRVDPRVLVPRSPIAELVEHRFVPWVRPASVRHVLDLGTGSGCIAVACAKAFPRALVDATDVSADALAVAASNVHAHRVQRRVSLIKSDHFRALAGRRYDIIVSNPPYVGARELKGLPPEYAHEPVSALAAGRDGLASIRIILRDAGGHLSPRGILVVEVGNTEGAVRRAFPRTPFTWLQFARGGGGVFLLTAEQLV